MARNNFFGSLKKGRKEKLKKKVRLNTNRTTPYCQAMGMFNDKLRYTHVSDKEVK
jgi:hypothetical protein